MSAACQTAAADAGSGVAAALRAVDCTAGEFTAQAFGRLFAPGGALTPVLTIALTLFVALFAIALLLGRTNLGVRSLTPRMVTLGLVVTFATSWVAYQSVVWNLAIGAPDWLASVLAGTDGSATEVFAQKIDVVFIAVQQATQGQEDIGAFSPAGILWLGAMLFLLGTVGVLVTARIGLAVLVALGPVFVVMALFNGTRGLFTGWLKGVVMLALTPLFAVLGGGVMLELAVPILATLSATPGQVDPQAAVAFFLIGAVHVALMIMVIKVAGTMVSGWRVFGLVRDDAPERGERSAASAAPQPAAAPAVQAAAAQAPSQGGQRRLALAPAGAGVPANDPGPAATTRRETRLVASPAGGQTQPLSPSLSRTSGIGSRFRAPQKRISEKSK
ncbi:type IV secretion system protein [Pelagerythrobacter marinus]|jgi:type IV secretion system protein VirB6|uniref:Type VI secretion protein n=1 Tax=Pelagerythrobacter marinus TaxID=538382 RepID=A0ABW9UU24_9SPHN|nr:type IV secretion system protein [Pelagerythrobacter marinus]MXO67491.1 type VI secretion protein [Pelagerythrobacter marinus]USA38472.1 type IV secretion system protein [Pelagerythrobacter marinus]WPZ07504.1 type IV secretion system protein [Pelagerythrobacter marinus]